MKNFNITMNRLREPGMLDFVEAHTRSGFAVNVFLDDDALDDWKINRERLESENAALRKAIAAVRALHEPGLLQQINKPRRMDMCRHCGRMMPCPTLTAIAGEEG